MNIPNEPVITYFLAPVCLLTGGTDGIGTSEQVTSHPFPLMG